MSDVDDARENAGYLEVEVSQLKKQIRKFAIVLSRNCKDFNIADDFDAQLNELIERQ